MSDTKSLDYSSTLALPVNKMPMKATPSEKEPELLALWAEQNLQTRQQAMSDGRPSFVLHDGPPYANGHLHLGHALNKVLKDTVIRSHRMMGFDAQYVPGWDCHGLPIEWKVEERLRSEGRSKDDVPVSEFRRMCRDYAEHWVSVQASEFERLGVAADFRSPYTTMAFRAEAAIAAELMKFAQTGQLYRGSKPVMWSVVERTALAEAEVEHMEFTSDAVWVKFPVVEGPSDLLSANIVVWTTTPWTLPANRALAYSDKGAYGLYEVVEAERTFGPRPGELFLLSATLADAVGDVAKLSMRMVREVSACELSSLVCAHPLCDMGYDFLVPMLLGGHVTHDSGTGFVHTAPGHGSEDFDVWTRHLPQLEARGFDTSVPFVVDDAGFLTDAAPGFGPSSSDGAARVFDDNGSKGDANERVVSALIEADQLVARQRHKHQYPHSWRSKKPVLFRNTPQWFVHMDRDLGDGTTLRTRSLSALGGTEFMPATGRNRLRGMLETRPDWVLSRQRRWGVPLTVFHDDTGVVLVDPEANAKVLVAFEERGADAWFEEGAKERFLSHRDDQGRWTMVTDVLDVWFDSGCTHSFVLEDRGAGVPPADIYLEGSDQHRGWFQSSLLESCATRGHAPYKKVVTHGFVMNEEGSKMSKSVGKVVALSDVVTLYGADVLRLWVMQSDFRDDVRIGPALMKATSDAHRKLRNTLRWMVGMLDHHDGSSVEYAQLPELERYMLHRLAEVEADVLEGYRQFDFRKSMRALADFLNLDLSAFYFVARKDALYCDAPSSHRRKSSFYVLNEMLRRLVKWMAPMLPFLAEEVWLAAYPEDGSVHLHDFESVPLGWSDPVLNGRWNTLLRLRSVVNLALEKARKDGVVGSASDARPTLYVSSPELRALVQGVDMAELCATSGVDVEASPPPSDATYSEDVPGFAAVANAARGKKCARSRSVTEDVGADLEYPDLSLRDAIAMRELSTNV